MNGLGKYFEGRTNELGNGLGIRKIDKIPKLGRSISKQLGG